MKQAKYTIDKITVARHFSRAAATYDKAAILQREVGQRLLERLDYFKLKPRVILDLGSGTGFFTKQLARRYPRAEILSLDISAGMLNYAKGIHPDVQRRHSILADAENLPLSTESVDLVFSNCTFQWCENPTRLFTELQRILKPTGLLLFSTFGPDTLKELRDSFRKISDEIPIHTFIDMHDIGDILLHQRFKNPVMDMEVFTLTYNRVTELRRDLKAMGANFSGKIDHLHSTKKEFFLKLDAQYEYQRNNEGNLPATFEVLYGHAFGTISNIESLNNSNSCSNEDLDFLQRIPLRVI